MFFEHWTTYDWCMGVAYLLIPIVVMWMTHKSSFLKKVGAMMACFFLGLIFGNLFRAPESHIAVRSLFTTVTIPLAIPLVLMGTDFKHWAKTSGIKTILAYLCSVLAVVTSGIIMLVLLRPWLPEANKMAGSLIGGFTGATMNTVAVAQAVHISDKTLTMMMSAMLVYEIPWMIFMVTCAKRVVGKFLRPFEDDLEHTNHIQLEAASNAVEADTTEWEGFRSIFTKQNFFPCLCMFGLSVGIYFFCKGVSLLFAPDSRSTVIIIGSSIMGILCSFIKPLQKIKGTYILGIYVVMIFAFPLTAGADLRMFIQPSMFYIFLFCCGMLYLDLILNVVYCKIAKVDTDTMLVTHAGAVFSPGYVPVVCTRLKNQKVLISGVASGIFGYATGSFLGILFAKLFSVLM